MEAQRRSKDKGEPEEAAAEIEAGGRRKEIADETIRETACVEAERLKPPFHEKWKKAEVVSTEKSGLFCFYNAPGATQWVAPFLYQHQFSCEQGLAERIGIYDIYAHMVNETRMWLTICGNVSITKIVV